jgi:8-oxo-dGTP pyrophosphatase MutT (NUDIX family)
MKGTPAVFRINRMELAFVPKPWVFAVERRAEIDNYFDTLRRDKPAVWNGQVLLMHNQSLKNGVLRGQYLQTDYASFAAWCAWGRPPAGVHDCFGAAAILTADDAFLLGVMGPHTFNAGKIYFLCGTPDPSDIIGNKVDLELSVAREVKEETGLDVAEFAEELGWTAIVEGPLIALIKVMRSTEPAVALRSRILENLSRQQNPELTDIRIVRNSAEIDPAMPTYVTTFLASRFAPQGRSTRSGTEVQQ